MADFLTSCTRANLLKAFAGESQAWSRYTFAAGLAKQQKLYVIEQTFQFTAQQEKEHAEIYWKLLSGKDGEQLSITADYPIFNPPDPLGLLKEANKNELAEHAAIYPMFAQTALDEGFPEIAYKFTSIAAIEQTHAQRFARFTQLLEQDKLFREDAPMKWLCLNCGHIHDGSQAPGKCPVCEHEQGYFIRESLTPFQ